ncbi:uncharacterized protein SOCEGT47_037170 [Sorangium cellulosum]|uniref:Uncharacterized protein n=1 Tax=Sorangium cellulosum TaxID=56 RepID=A0A4P2Q1S9_SORCE|nr:uncharacterized protein SOCEGT47_037170 [Sorangium cellulosum]
MARTHGSARRRSVRRLRDGVSHDRQQGRQQRSDPQRTRRVELGRAGRRPQRRAARRDRPRPAREPDRVRARGLESLGGGSGGRRPASSAHTAAHGRRPGADRRRAPARTRSGPRSRSATRSASSSRSTTSSTPSPRPGAGSAEAAPAPRRPQRRAGAAPAPRRPQRRSRSRAPARGWRGWSSALSPRSRHNEVGRPSASPRQCLCPGATRLHPRAAIALCAHPPAGLTSADICDAGGRTWASREKQP